MGPKEVRRVGGYRVSALLTDFTLPENIIQRMKTLLILRHAKSSWDNPALTDHERRLNKRGLRDAPRIGRLLREQDLLPDLIACSTAERARQTTAAVAEHSGYQGEIEFTGELYHATPQSCIQVLHEQSGNFSRVLLVAHNPGLELLVEMLSGHNEPFPTAALAQIELEVDCWTELTPHTDAQLVNLWRPKELDD